MNRTIIEQKNNLRIFLKEKLKSTENNLKLKTECENNLSAILFESSLFRKADLILSFLSLKSEISTEKITTQCLKNNKKIFVPRINDDNKTMTFYQLDKTKSIEAQTEKNIYQIPEPVTTLSVLNKNTITEKTLLLIPGLGFSTDGSRLGRGKGFYDYFLESIPHCTKIGLCYSFQIINGIPSEEHDKKVDYLLTEKNLLLCKKEL